MNNSTDGIAVSTQGYRKINRIGAGELDVPTIYENELDRRIAKLVAEDREKMILGKVVKNQND